MTSMQQQQQPNNRRQIMQPWPLCLAASFGKPKERAILPKQYSRVPTITRGASSSQLAQDCSSNTTLLTQVSPFNSQVTLEDNQKRVETSVVQQHYYADNLRNNHHKALNGSQIYDPNNKEYCKQLDPLLGKDEPASDTKILMDSKDYKMPTAPPLAAMIPQFQKEMRCRRPYYSTQVLAALAVSIGSMIVGFASCYTSPATASLQNGNITDFEVTKDMTTWIGSVMPASAVFGAIVGGAMIEYFGRRNTILSLSVPFFFSWILIGMASNVGMVLAGRSLGGFCVGVLTLAMPVYLGETMKPEVRGTLGLMPTAIGNIGMMLCNVIGIWCNWWELALASALIAIPFAGLMMMVPETPRWYIGKGKAKRAKKSLQWLRGRGADVSEELQATEKMQVDSERQAAQSDSSELLRLANLKPLSISLGLMFFQQMSGINAVMFYTESIFAESGSSLPEKYCVLIVNVVNFLATFVAASLIDRLGRKLLLYVSSLSMIVSLAVLGASYFCKHNNYNFTGLDLLPLICLVVYVLGFSLGFGPVPWLMMGEILPARVRGSAASIVTCFNWTCTFVVTKVFQTLIDNIGSSGTFWLASGICLVGLFFVIFFVPETSGRSLEEIERGLTGQSVRRMSSVANIKPTPMAC